MQPLHRRLEPAPEAWIAPDLLHRVQELAAQEGIALDVDAISRAQDHVIDAPLAPLVQLECDTIRRRRSGHDRPVDREWHRLQAGNEPGGAGGANGARTEPIL